MSKMTMDGVVNSYKMYAPFYDFLFGLVFQNGRDLLVREVERIQPKRILEVGVGTGLMIPLYPEHIPLVGVDISRDMLKLAHEKVPPNRQAPVSLQESNGESLPFETHSFDCVTVPYTYSVTPDPEKFMREVRRVCAPDGHIVIANHFSDLSTFWGALEKVAKPFANKIGFNADFSYRRFIEEVDWQVETSVSANLLNLSRVVVVRNTPHAKA